MAVTITHSTPADGTFSATGAAAWDASHSVSGLGTMAEQNSNNVNITGGSITGVTGVLTGLTVNSTPTSGGAAGQIMFDTGSVLQESSNLVWDNTAKRLTLTGYSLTGTSALSQLDLSGTWNTTGTPTAIKLNVTNTASNAASLLMDLQVGGVSRTNIRANIGTQTWNLYGTDGVTVAGRIEYSTPGAAPGLIFYTDLGTANRINFAYRATNTIFAFGWGSVTGNAQLGVTSTGNTIVPNFAAFSWNSTDLNTANTPDLFLTRRGAANLRFGAADAAAPVAQTLSVQSVVAGTSNTAGANLTITGSQGTGTGAGGSIIFQTAPAGSSGTAQNALVNALIINNAGLLQFAGTTSSFPALKRSTTILQVRFADDSNYSPFECGSFSAYGSITLRGATESIRRLTWNGVGQIRVQSDGVFTIMNDAATGFGRLQFGGTTSSFPAIKQSTTTLQVRLADDSAYAPVEASTVCTATAYTVATLPVAGTAGRRAYVTDALAPTFLGALMGGGTVVTPVFDTGTQWVAG